MHPGGGIELLNWMIKKKIKWFGIDCGSGDHSMNTSIRHMRPDLAKRFEEKVGKSCEEFFGEYSYIHNKSGRKITENIFPFHSYAFQEGIVHAENIGGDIEKMLNQRAVIGAFPWRYEGLEACPCRIVCFQGMDENVEAVGDVAKAILGPRRIASGVASGGPDGR
jgi:kynurenine formamidase